MSEENGFFGPDNIPYFNGGLFTDNTAIELNLADLGILYSASQHDWSHIEPAIFGTLFERSLDQTKRSMIGAHYTSAADILLLIEPVVIDPLRRRWDTVKAAVLNAVVEEAPGETGSSANGAQLYQPGASPQEVAPANNQGLKARPIVAPAQLPAFQITQSRRPTQPRLGLNRPALALLEAWAADLSQIRILDPACGSGNFLYVSLKRLLDLWHEARVFGIGLGLTLSLDPMPSPAQLFGIEIDFYAHEIASVVVWIGFLQWQHDHGIKDQKEPLLRKLSNIEHADAILRYDESEKTPEHPAGKPYEPEWPAADFIVGNPPFLGGKLLRRELGDTYVDAVFDLYRGRVKAESDLVVYWFEKARHQLETGQVNRVGLLATQAIRGGANRAVLDRILEAGTIFWAWSDRNWLLKGATVHVSMIAFERRELMETFPPAGSSEKPDAPSSTAASSPAEVGYSREARTALPESLNDAPGAPSMTVSPSWVGSPQTSAPTAPPIPAQGNTLGHSESEHEGLQARSITPAPTPAGPPDALTPTDRSLVPESTTYLLDGQPVPFINADLTSGSDTASAHRLKENQGICFMGTTKVGSFDIDAETARKMLSAPLNPNGKPNSDVVRPWVNALDITRRPREMFVIDFGTDTTEQQAALYELPFEYVKHHVKPVRLGNSRETYAKRWWIHGEARGDLRRAVQPLTRYIATPRHSRHRVFVWLQNTTVPDSANFAFARKDEYFMGVLHSSAHEL